MGIRNKTMGRKILMKDHGKKKVLKIESGY